MGKKEVAKSVARIREDLKSLHPSSFVLIEQGELMDILDRLEKLEKREAKRKAKKLPAPVEAIVEGDRVELVATFETHIWPYVEEGRQGTVERVDAWGSHAYRVNLDGSNNHALSFMAEEIRKVA